MVTSQVSAPAWPCTDLESAFLTRSRVTCVPRRGWAVSGLRVGPGAASLPPGVNKNDDLGL